MPGEGADKKWENILQERGFQMAGGSKMQGDIVIGNLSCQKKCYCQFETSTKPVYVAQ